MDKTHFLIAIRAALEAGQAILDIYNDPAQDFQIERKADNSPLTIADRRAHQLIAERLAITPYPLLSEEGRHLPYEQRRTWHALWIVDPLDGTKEFIKRNGEFTVNIAYVEDGTPRAGVVYVPVKRVLYFADDEMGAYRTDDIGSAEGLTLAELCARSVGLPTGETHEGLRVVASRSHLSPETQAYIDDLRRRFPRVELVNSGSSIKICLVAEGSADVYPRFGPTMEWDTAAGHAVLRASGGHLHHTDSPAELAYNKADLLNPWFVVER